MQSQFSQTIDETFKAELSYRVIGVGCFGAPIAVVILASFAQHEASQNYGIARNGIDCP